jgi:anti-sigma factor RsiW
MMDRDSQLKLQSFLDGELSESQAREVAAWVEQDADAKALFAELRQTRQDLRLQDQPVKLPETREFFWSKIEREIQRQEQVVAPAQNLPWWQAWRRILVPVGGVAGLVLAGMIAGGLLGTNGRPQMETAAADTGALTYHDYDGGTTLVWLSYPAENEFADSDSFGTIQ